jgi:hypothetical protein
MQAMTSYLPPSAADFAAQGEAALNSMGRGERLLAIRTV